VVTKALSVGHIYPEGLSPLLARLQLEGDAAASDAAARRDLQFPHVRCSKELSASALLHRSYGKLTPQTVSP